MEARVYTSVPLRQEYGPQLAPYAAVLRGAAFEVGGFRLGNCCAISASWRSPQGVRYLASLEALDGEASVKANLVYLSKVAAKQAPTMHWLFSWMWLDSPADLTRLLTQCVALAEARQPPVPTGRPPLRHERRTRLMALLLEPLARCYRWAGFNTATKKR